MANYILVVDDTPANIDVLFDYLDEVGFEVAVATSGDNALKQCGYSKPDLILLDVMMPDMDGFETCRQLKADPALQDIPVIFMTALTDSSDKLQGFQAGAVDYITKPFQHEEVLARVNTHLTIGNLQRQLQATNVELQQANQVLELRVAQRTADLERVNTDLEAEIVKRRAAYQGLAKLNEAYSRFVPKEFLGLLHQHNIVEVALGDNRQMDMTVMFSDIRSFTTMSEQMTPAENFKFINAYFGRVGPVIRQHRGFVDKFIGDAIMALFPTQPENALKAALAILETLRLYNETRDRPDRLPIKTGIGLHVGPVMLGAVGEPERLEATVISDAVNVAARLEQLTKLYGATIIISGQLFAQVRDISGYHVRFLGQVQVKGKQNTIPIFEVFDGNSPRVFDLKLKTKSNFEQGVSCYFQKQYPEAQNYFEQILAINPDDRATRLYLDMMTSSLNQADELE